MKFEDKKKTPRCTACSVECFFPLMARRRHAACPTWGLPGVPVGLPCCRLGWELGRLVSSSLGVDGP